MIKFSDGTLSINNLVVSWPNEFESKKIEEQENLSCCSKEENAVKKIESNFLATV